MRCEYCGWNIPDSKGKCEKCGGPMVIDEPEVSNGETYANSEHPTTHQPLNSSANLLKATIRESSMNLTTATVQEDNSECPECGHELENGVCPSCGYSRDDNTEDLNELSKKPMNDNKKTIRPHRKEGKEGRFILTPISEETGQPEGDLIQYEGDEVILNRENTDPKNTTITSQQQATICYSEGKWGIIDQSEYKTTFVQASRTIELQDGDLILLGNQLYRFDNITE